MKVNKKSLHAIPSSLREKKRYVLFSVKSEKPVQALDVERSFQQTLLSLYGSMDPVNIKLIDWDSQEQRGILKCARAVLPKVKSGLVFVRLVTSIPVILKVDKVSGTIKKLRNLK